MKSYLSANFSHRNIFINASLVFMQRLIQKDNAIKRYRFTEGAGVSFISIRFKDLKDKKELEFENQHKITARKISQKDGTKVDRLFSFTFSNKINC